MSSNWLIDLEKKAKGVLSKAVYDFVAGGAGDESSLANNLSAYRNYSVIPRVLSGVSSVDTSLVLSNTKLASPIIIAPTAPHKLLHEKGELATVEAAGKTQSLMITSCMASMLSGVIAKESNGPLWFQLHIFKDRKATLNLINKAEIQGYQTLVVTVDMPIVGSRERDKINHFKIPQEALAKNLINEGLISESPDNNPLKSLSMNELFDSSVTWRDIEWLKSNTSLPIYLKGILHQEDAKKAIDIGVDGIIVSNHGARQLGCSVAPLDVMPAVRKEAGVNFPIIVDGGIRSGADIFKALALGATAVLVGRPILWGLAVGGSYGVIGVLNRLNMELQQVMLLSGLSNLSDINVKGVSMLLSHKKLKEF